MYGVRPSATGRRKAAAAGTPTLDAPGAVSPPPKPLYTTGATTLAIVIFAFVNWTP